MGGVFVTDGEQRASLAVVRSLGRAGVSVTVGGSAPRTLAGSSRYCARQVRYPSPLDRGEDFQAFLRDELQGWRSGVLIPMTDITTLLIAQARETLNPLVMLPIPSEEQITLARDKGRVLLLAQKLGIPCPLTFIPSERHALEEVAGKLRYPAVVKPRFSRFYQRDRWVSGGVRYAYDSEDLISKYRDAQARIPDPLIQERIKGEGRGVFLLIWDGELKAAFCHRRLREKPPWGGVSVYRESIALDEKLVEESAALLKALGWKGAAMVEFKVDERDGQAKLMEINGRFWGSLQLAIDAGMDFPLLLYRLACGENVAPQFQYEVGVKSRWLLGDLDHLLIRLRHSGPPNGLPGPSVSRFRACLDFLKLYERKMYYEILRFDDPRPGWFELKSYVRDTLRHLRRAKEKSSAD